MKRSLAVSAFAALLLAGCSPVPHIDPQVSQMHTGDVGLGEHGSDQSVGIADHWWEAFGDPQLSRLIEAGLADNPTLAAALARVRGAQAAVGIEHAGQLPQIGIDGQEQGQRFSNTYLIPPPYAGTWQFTSTVQAGLSWDLDLFGRHKARVAQARAGLDATQMDAAAARLAISTSIAQTYIGLAQAQAQIAVAQGFVDTRTHALTYVQSRIRNHLSSEFDLRTAQTLLAEAEQAKVRAERQRDLLVHALAALAGHGANFYPSVTPPTLALDKPIDVPAVLPIDLLGRRPDLLAGQARIDAAVAGRKVARADFMPNVNLQGVAGMASIGFGNLFAAGSAQGGGGAAFHIPIFEGGKLKAQYKGATADLDLAVADYNEIVLQAVRQSADALTDIKSADADLAQQRKVVAGLRDTVRLDQARVATGLGSNLDAVDSGFRLLEAEQSLINLQAETLNHRVALIAALGGGFNPTSPLVAAN